MSHEPRDEAEGIAVDRKVATPMLAAGVLPGNEVVSVVDGHQHNDDPPQHIERSVASGSYRLLLDDLGSSQSDLIADGSETSRGRPRLRPQVSLVPRIGDLRRE